MLFLRRNDSEDLLYANVRDCNRYKKIKIQLEFLWESFKNIAPNDFREKLQLKGNFHQRWWEMYCGVGLLNMGNNIITSKVERGPDFCFLKNGHKHFIEAIAPCAGNGDDKLLGMQYSEKPIVAKLPEEEFLLRITNSLKEKRKKYSNYISKDIVSENDSLIIAISSCNLHQYGSLMDYPVPAPLKVLFGIGCPYINLETKETSLTKRPDILKLSGNKVDTRYFEREDMKIITAILYSNSDPLNSPDDPRETFLLIKNPNAIIQIDSSSFPGILAY